TAETIRLVDGPGHCEGRLEVLQKSIWGHVLDHQWDMKEAKVVFRQLHCGEAIGSFRLKESISGTVAWNSVTRQGSEKHIEDCSVTINSYSVTSSNLVTDVSVICSAAEERSVSLVDSFHHCAGLVEVYRRCERGMIRGDAWDLEDGDVICRELRCGSILKVEGQSISGTGKLWLTGLNCAGNETALWKCPLSSWGTSTSEEKEAARVACSGRLEIYYNGSWGSVCSNLMISHSVSVICKELNCGQVGSWKHPLHTALVLPPTGWTL
ncbi:hypothetical protein AB205_0002070, partial [Aquarana catesbeiana]